MAADDTHNPPTAPAEVLLRRVVALVAEHNLAEISVEDGGLSITVRGIGAAAGTEAAVMPQMLSQAPIVSQTPPLLPATASASLPIGGVRIAQEAPMVGVYYCAPSPEDPPFVTVGDTISIGQPIGLIEAMKVYSELPSEVAGRVVEIAVQNGKLVQQGQPILFVEPL